MAVHEVVEIDASDQDNVCCQEIILDHKNILDLPILSYIVSKSVANEFLRVQAALKTPLQFATSVLSSRNGYTKETVQQCRLKNYS